ncbi:hypothetical protein EGW08_018002 [Elysia chlorotica]|uniref:Transmembrane protein 144 n=1 Tax=Elysia chlorotica TaxID=188477 RepID=A0A3S1B803_ELYCH|nr:hypothetical protein EGW08_018002 [Elysia chlorotica]
MAASKYDPYGTWITNVTTPDPATTTAAPDKPYPVYVGFICAIIAVILYGSNFIPVKKYYTGDGMFFQFVLCNGIFLVGIVLQLIRNSKFFPLVMVGGAIWATDAYLSLSLLFLTVIKTIGMGLGISLWGTVALVAGWASGKFGWFGTDRDSIGHVGLNYGGVVLAACSILLYVLVKDEISSAKTADQDIEVGTSDDVAPLIPEVNIQDGHSQSEEELLSHSALHDDRLFIEDFPPTTKKLTGLVLCLLSGICYGLNFVPSIYVQDNYSDQGATKNGLDYVFAQYCGIYLASAVYFYIYCLMKKNSPKVYPQVILPGLVSGILWAIATACWFVANAELSESVSFPIVSTGPSAIASLFWGVCVFREVRGVRNILILVSGFLVMTAGALLAGFSR